VKKMAREFNKNIFIMLLSIMIGVIIITYFVADIVNRSKLDTLTTYYQGEITTVKGKSENFTSSFIKSSVILDSAREDRAFGNYHFDLGFLWYQSVLYEANESEFVIYKQRGIDNCTNAMPSYHYSFLNFIEAKIYFNNTKSFTELDKYLDILNLYIELTASGSRLTMLRYNASKYLLYLLENLTFDEEKGVIFEQNVSDLLKLFDKAIDDYNDELEVYEDAQDEIDEYEFFDEKR
jgi:hypothetical protein